MIDFIDKTAEQNGTEINRRNLMAMQGFYDNNVTINADENDNYTIKEINSENGHMLTTSVTENQDGSITIIETFKGEKTITKTTTVDAEMNTVNEVIE